ncbi:uncharacterized protein LOC119722645 [Patiria miniata]|uniref:Uncharacterized protein n=1 Tax=Patiria miniata TaxID=46514 RepID=A0A913ZCY3_PATMI|nr:uncharacterized protein LOC119722645 [Patiria miniata]
MKRKPANRSQKASRSADKRKGTHSNDENDQQHDQFIAKPNFRKGGAYSTMPEQPGSTPTDWRVGVVMAICLPISILIFWKITLPLMWWIFTLIVGSDFAKKLSFFKEDLVNIVTSECPIWISAQERAFLNDRSHDNILRVSDISREDFEKIVRRGEPVIVTDALRDWEAFGLYDCGYFMRKFPEAEYFDWQGQERISLGNITKRQGFTGLQCASGYMETKWKSNQKYIKEWLRKMPPPYFLMEDMYTSHPFGKDEEPSVTGFLGVPGTGVSPHLDEICDTIMTVQLSGVKNWSVSWPVKDGSGVRWSKPIVFTLYPGEAMFWYVAMRHHTEVIEDCSLSFSFLLKSPAPTDYLQRLVQDLSSVPRAERDALFQETEAAKVDYIDSCGIITDTGRTFIT